eukprot:13410079-Alexandrium_andersonii.AAC.1
MSPLSRTCAARFERLPCHLHPCTICTTLHPQTRTLWFKRVSLVQDCVFADTCGSVRSMQTS